jgi:hypothetical protein
MKTSPFMQVVWFLVGFGIAVLLVLLMGCDRAVTSGGVWVERDPPTMCCMALTPSCEACQEGYSVDEWLEKTCGPNAIDAEYAHWDVDTNEPVWLCQVEIIN